MRTLSDEEVEKLHYLDTLFSALPIDELKRMATDEEVVAILKDKPILNGTRGIFFEMYLDHAQIRADMATQHDEVRRTKQLLNDLIRTLEEGQFSPRAHSDFNSLKSRIYY